MELLENKGFLLLPALPVKYRIMLSGYRAASDRRVRASSNPADVDVVIDYLWGQPTTAAMTAVVADRSDRGKPLTWIEIGSVAGSTALIPSAALRAARLQIVGSGQGSVSAREILAELPALAQEITNGTFEVDARPTPLTEVEKAWADAIHTAQRIVLTPQP